MVRGQLALFHRVCIERALQRRGNHCCALLCSHNRGSQAAPAC